MTLTATFLFYNSGNLAGNFEIYPEKSIDKLILRNIRPLDYENISSYVINISAANEDTGKSTSINVTIDVIDENDNAPNCSQRYFIFLV